VGSLERLKIIVLAAATLSLISIAAAELAWNATGSEDWEFSNTKGTYYDSSSGLKIGEYFGFEDFSTGTTPERRGWSYSGTGQDSSNYAEVVDSDSLEGSKSLELSNDVGGSVGLYNNLESSKPNPVKMEWHFKVVNPGNYYHGRVSHYDSSGSDVFQPYFEDFSFHCGGQTIADRNSGTCWESYSNNQWYKLTANYDYSSETVTMTFGSTTKTVGFSDSFEAARFHMDSDGSNLIVDRLDAVQTYYSSGYAVNSKDFEENKSWGNLEVSSDLNSGSINLEFSADTDSDGDYESSKDFSLTGGDEQLELSDVEEGDSARINISMATTDVEDPPVLHEFRLNASKKDFCDYRGDRNQCIVNTSRELAGGTTEISETFISKENSLLERLSGEKSILNITNTSKISGTWRGNIHISSNQIRVKPGGEFQPDENRIIIEEK
jgi:hypothetical protein